MGNIDSGDGYKYRGRGLLQLTGRDSYKNTTDTLREYNPACPDFVLDPDQVVDAGWCLEVAGAEERVGRGGRN